MSKATERTSANRIDQEAQSVVAVVLLRKKFRGAVATLDNLPDIGKIFLRVAASALEFFSELGGC